MSYLTSISYSRAKDIVLKETQKYFKHQQESIDTAEGCLRVLASPVVSEINVPAFKNSAMDGFAIRYSDLPDQQGWLELQPVQYAGDTSTQKLNEFSAIPIMTGAMLPEGADTVVIKENSESKDGKVYLREIGNKGAYIRDIGSDIRKGSLILNQSQRLRPQDLGLISSAGYKTTSVFPKVKVVVFTGGDEIVHPGVELQPGQVYDSVQPTLLSLLKSLGCDVVHAEQLEDDPLKIEKAFNQFESDSTIIITNGAVSAGDKDFILGLMKNQGQIHFHKTNIKPGFPMLFGQYKRSLFFGLPGNPVSSFVTFCQFVLPALRVLEGEQLKPTPVIKARLTRAYSKQHYRREFVRARLTYDPIAGFEVTVSGHQSSGRLTSVTDSNCFIVFDETPDDFKVGDTVSVQRFIDLLYPHFL